MTITSEGRTLGGQYHLWWGIWVTKPDETNFLLVAGSAERNTYEVTIPFNVPEVPYKATGHLLSFYNSLVNPDGPAASVWFKVEPSIEVKPAQVSSGDRVTISGKGFTAKDEIKLTFDGKPVDIELETNGLGSFTTKYTLPDTTAGKHTFEATAKEMFNVDPLTAKLTIAPEITMQPEKPDIGTEVTLIGTGFAANSKISITYDGETVANSPKTDEFGKFSHSFIVPESSESEHEIVVTDKEGNEAAFGLPLEGKAPDAPSTISPRAERFGWFGSQVVAFNWAEVEDPSGVTYTLEIADNLNFFPLAPGMRKAELTQTTCLVSIDPGTYYWRVRATDGAGNKGEWTLSPYSFRVGFFATWHLVIGGFIVLIIFIFVIRAFFRRIGEYF